MYRYYHTELKQYIQNRKKYDYVLRQLKSYVLHNKNREIISFSFDSILG